MPTREFQFGDFHDLHVDHQTRQLFWRGQEVVTTTRLPWWVQLSAIVAAISTFGLFIEGLIPLLKQL